MRTSTFNQLVVSLTSLLQSIPYDELTVSALCKEANITRRTFYNRYKSIDDLVRRIFLDMFYDDCYHMIMDESYFKSMHFIEGMINTWDRYGELFLALDRWNVLEYLTKDNVEVIISLINEKFTDEYIMKYPEYFIASRFASIGNLCMIWLKKGRHESKEELVEIIRHFIYHQEKIEE